MFVDIAKIKIKAGDGGAGAVAFHREKYVAAGGPDGGDGGKGGDVVFVVDDNLATLADFRYKRKYVAKNGENGRGSRQYGKKAPFAAINLSVLLISAITAPEFASRIIVPLGTLISRSGAFLPYWREPLPFSP